jgi:sugar phosphate isomerase/epimerase
MIYISSSSVKANKISSAVEVLADNGFKNIELSGGTLYYSGYKDELLELKEKYKLNYLCHNYFPPPQKDFVLNLASLNNKIYEKTIRHIIKAIDVSAELNASQYGFHAGYFMDIAPVEIGKKLSLKNLFNKEEAIQKFIDGYKVIRKHAETKNVKIYIENNVLSLNNYEVFNNINPLMLVNYNDYLFLKDKIPFNLLLDIAHLKVTARTLSLDFSKEFSKLIKTTDYIHISDNNGMADTNKGIDKSSDISKILSRYKLKDKTITLEIYEDIATIEQSYSTIDSIINTEL